MSNIILQQYLISLQVHWLNTTPWSSYSIAAGRSLRFPAQQVLLEMNHGSAIMPILLVT